MFIKHRFFLSTIAFFLHDSILSLHTNVSPHNSLHSLRMTAYLSPHGFISPSPHGFISPSPHGFIPPLHTDSFLLSTWIHFPSPHGFIPPLHTDSFLLSARLHTPLHTEHPLFFWYIQQTRKRKIHLHCHNCYCEYFTSQ